MADFDSYSDVELIVLLKQDSLDAFTTIHKRYYGVLYSHTYKRLPDREEVKDILQELFTYLWNKRGTIHFNVDLKAYLYTAVRNKILNVFKHQKVRDNYALSFANFLISDASTPDEVLRVKELIALIDAEVSALPPQMRLVFELSRKANLSHQEIAEELNISPLTVKKQVNNSLRILRVKLAAHFFMFFL